VILHDIIGFGIIASIFIFETLKQKRIINK